MDPRLKEIFRQIKKDIGFLSNEILFLHENLAEITGKIEKIDDFLKTEISTKNVKNKAFSTHSSTHDYAFKGLKSQNMPISTGNGGVSTDRQTDRQTDNNPPISYEKTEISAKNPKISGFEQAEHVLNSLDNIKKEIRLKFKKLTNQEMSIFSAIYQLEEEKGYADYSTIANVLRITESSTRDHVSRIIKKGIPVEKRKIGNKKIQLYISKNLKKLTSLSTILQLRDI